MEYSIRSNFDKLSYIAQYDSKYMITESKLSVVLKGNVVNVDISNVSNVRIIRRRSLVLNYLMMFFLISLFMMVKRLVFLNDLSTILLNICTGILCFSTLFVTKYSCKLLLNYKDLSYQIFRLESDISVNFKHIFGA
ncbi:MAG: positive regulator of sigma E activity [Psychroserpens sp.]|jgi:positive regulator of sigma E activity